MEKLASEAGLVLPRAQAFLPPGSASFQRTWLPWLILIRVFSPQSKQGKEESGLSWKVNSVHPAGQGLTLQIDKRKSMDLSTSWSFLLGMTGEARTSLVKCLEILKVCGSYICVF